MTDRYHPTVIERLRALLGRGPARLSPEQERLLNQQRAEQGRLERSLDERRRRQQDENRMQGRSPGSSSPL